MNGGAAVRFVDETGALATLGGRALAGLAARPLDLRAWVRQMDQIGVQSLGVAAITTVFTGMVLALQTALSLPSLGVKYYIGTVVAKSLVRELAPVLVALIVGGRVGAGMTAELGSMAVSEQVDALRSLGADPVRRLVVPKLAATLVMLPALTALGDLLGILGGLVIAVLQLGLTPAFYLNDVLSELTLQDVGSGLGKSVFFGFFITIVACRQGLAASGGADGVGRATTRTVVIASILVLVSDFFLTKLFYLLG
ncbi:MAG: ABC transporter permease [Thermoanaerobaculia bacterium]|nr:MAG: ABC transporter permease [Thermoanaerobaculia bacterium]